MKREEAINLIKQVLPCLNIDKKIREGFETLIPELRESEDESEDERIRKEILGFIKSFWADHKESIPRISSWLAYLEKQKGASKAIEAVERIDKYIDEHLANAHDMKDSNPDKKYYRGWDDALGKMAGILQDVYSGEKQKESLRDFIDNFPYSDEQKEQSITANDLDEEIHRFFDDCIDVHEAKLYGSISERVIPVDCYELTARHFAKWGEKQKEQKHPNGCFTCDEYKKGYEEGRRNGFTAGYNKAMKEVDEQKEQKPVVTHGEAYRVDTLGTQQVIAGKMPQKLAEWSEEDEGELQNAIDALEFLGKKGVYKSESGYDAALQAASWLKSLSLDLKKRNEDVTKLCSNEWSEEDEENMQAIVDTIKMHWLTLPGNTLIDWFKSLRNRVGKEFLQPHWKPSEDEERLIKTSISFLKDFADKGYENAVECIDWLKSKLNGNSGK